MPFTRYLQDGSQQTQDGLDDANSEDAIHFQIPSFMYSGAPTLAQGGGAEVLPFHSTWFANNGFTPHIASPRPPLAITAPSPLGLPVYSASGFDVLSILARVATRPNPHIVLGPVDLTCSFVIVDVRRHDNPIVYCSPSFCRLTGYEEYEILGRNCRFLQAPGGAVRRGDERRFTSQQAVATLRKALSADKEVQTSIVNFRKDGSAFINLVSVVPIPGGVTGAKHELNDVVYHVGFQVDLTEQPNVILEKLRNGTYIQSQQPSGPAAIFASTVHSELGPPPPSRKAFTLPQLIMSPILAALLQSKAFLRALPISTSTTAPQPPPPTTAAPTTHSTPTNNPLSLLLLEYAPDFIHVVSLKGAFLYVAPAVTRVLGYTPAELVGKSMADLAHPEDVVPLERQLKESSTLLPGPFPTTFSSASPNAPNSSSTQQGQAQARIVDVLFRARTKPGAYVWVECRGRLHVEPGKGRKAIVLSGRASAMPRVCWRHIVRAAGGLAGPMFIRDFAGDGNGTAATKLLTDTEIETETEVRAEAEGREVHVEFWAQLAGRGHSAGALVSIGTGVGDVLGYDPDELLGRRIGTLVVGGEGAAGIAEALLEDRCVGGGGSEVHDGGDEDGVKTTTVYARLRAKSGAGVRVLMVFYRSGRGALDPGLSVAPAPVLLQVRMLDGPGAGAGAGAGVVHPLNANIFEELEVSRGSSWQYELQQLRYANLRLEEEVKALEVEHATYQDKERQKRKGKGKVQSKGKGKGMAGEQQSTMGPASTSAFSTAPASAVSMGFADIASAGMGMGDVYPDLALGMGLGIGVGGEHTNYAVALEQYEAAAGRGYTATGTDDDSALMPAPTAVPTRRYHQYTPHHQHHHQRQQQDRPAPAPAPAPPPPPPRPQTPAHGRQSCRPSFSQQQQQQQHQSQTVYAPVPLPVTIPPSALMHAIDPPQPQARQQVNQYPLQVQRQLQSLRTPHPRPEWSNSLHPGVKRPAGR